MVMWIELLDYGAMGHGFESRFSHPANGKLCQPSSKWVPFSGMDKAVKGEGWALLFICCAQDTVGLLPPLPPQSLGYGKPLPLPFLVLSNFLYVGRTCRFPYNSFV